MLKEHDKTFVGIARAVDLGVITASFAVGAAVCERLKAVEPLAWVPGWGSSHALPSASQYALLFVASLGSWAAVARWRGTYSVHRTEGSLPILWHNTVSHALWIMLVGFCAFILKLEMISRTFFVMFLLLSMLLLHVRQTAAYFVLKFLRAKGFNLRSVAIVGDPEGVARFSEVIESQVTTGYRIVKAWTGQETASRDPSDMDFDELFVVISDGSTDRDRLILDLMKRGKRVHFVPAIIDASLFRQDVNDFDGIPVLSLGGYGLNGLQAGAKRLLDIVGSLILLLVLGPVMAIVALLVRTSSPGPILFRQERLGEGGHRFHIYKFRTMYEDAERILRSDPLLYQKYVENNYKLPKGADPRITHLGGFLRRSSLDELPQLFNVLKNDMSLVGPRPIVPPEIDKYGEYGVLFRSVKPGVTGKWQIHGRSEVADYSHRATLDIEYIRDQSVKTDVDILLKTIPAVLLRKGAY